MVRDSAAEAPARVLVIATLGAVPRRRRSRRSREVAAELAPAPVMTTRATVVDGEPVAVGEAERWLADAGAEAVGAGFAVVERAVAAQRVAAADPGVVAPALAHALVVRAGFGPGEEVADGRWQAARELLPPELPPRRRSVALAPQERVAALLGARAEALLCEELALRARADVDAGRTELAALSARAALEAALTELPACAEAETLAARIAELREHGTRVAALGDAALAGRLAPDAHATLATALDRLAAALRARVAAANEVG